MRSALREESSKNYDLSVVRYFAKSKLISKVLLQLSSLVFS